MFENSSTVPRVVAVAFAILDITSHVLSLLKNLSQQLEVPSTQKDLLLIEYYHHHLVLLRSIYVPSSTVTRPVFLTVTFPVAELTPIPVPAIIDSTALVAPTSIQPAHRHQYLIHIVLMCLLLCQNIIDQQHLFQPAASFG